MQRAEITEKIGKINIKIAIANKELAGTAMVRC